MTKQQLIEALKDIPEDAQIYTLDQMLYLLEHHTLLALTLIIINTY